MELESLRKQIEQDGFLHYGFTPLANPLSIAHYKTWLEKDYQADMDYLKRHYPQKEKPEDAFQNLFPAKKALSAIVITHPYYPLPKENFETSNEKENQSNVFTDKILKKLKVALYARGPDYHDWFQSKLDGLCRSLKAKYPQEDFVAFTDSKPVLERDLAYRAGLGWIGKNTCLISEKKGSLFFIGEIYTTLKLQPTLELHPDRCGTCTKCIDICPTNALVEPKVLDANKCISYWTIEAKTVAPEPLRSQLGKWYFGCDLCQTVCPWNQKLFKQEMQSELADYSKEDLIVLQNEVLTIMKASDADIKKLFEGTPLTRAKPWAHKRNAIIIATNYGFKELANEIEKLRIEPKLSELVEWSLQSLLKQNGHTI